jgi:hypothetical protein
MLMGFTESQSHPNAQTCDLQIQYVIEMHREVICRVRMWSKCTEMLSSESGCDPNPEACDLQTGNVIHMHGDSICRFRM